jgi:hypothetical protein
MTVDVGCFGLMAYRDFSRKGLEGKIKEVSLLRVCSRLSAG